MKTVKEFKTKLEEKIKEAELVLLSPHMNADFDTIASCIGMALIVRKLGKQPYIIMDEDPVKMEPGVKVIIDEIQKRTNGRDGENFVTIIPSSKYRKIQTKNDLLIALDLNKSYLTSCQDYLTTFNNIVVIDHHQEDANTISCDCKFIDTSLSSVSEFITELLSLSLIKYDKRIADYLLAGIYLDTNKLRRNTTANTMKLTAKLMEKGADLNRVNELFAEDFVSDRKVQDLISRTDFFNYTVATALANPSERFTREELAKVADYLLRFRADASFAVGYIDDDTISISARSKGLMNVGEIMHEFGGGGNQFSAAGKVMGDDIENVGYKLKRVLKPKFYLDIPEEKEENS